jgi:hypothetical protein
VLAYRIEEEVVECKCKNKLYLSRFVKKKKTEQEMGEKEEEVKSPKRGSKGLVLNKSLTISSGYFKN